MRLAALVAAVALVVVPGAAGAVLKVGANAPDFQTRGAVGGKQFNLKLSQQLRKGPVVLYFFPAAFTQGCTLETREFAEKIDEFRKAGATVVGMSGDPIEKLSRFSVEECRSKFPVATASAAIIDGYDVKLKDGLTNRTSYVIARNGKVVYAHSDMDYRHHVSNTLTAVRGLKAARR
jgi:peroxiredoxin